MKKITLKNNIENSIDEDNDTKPISNDFVYCPSCTDVMVVLRNRKTKPFKHEEEINTRFRCLSCQMSFFDMWEVQEILHFLNCI